MRKILITFFLIVILSGCSVFAESNVEGNPQNYQPIETQRVLELLCDASTNCIEQQCPDLATCPLIIALSHPLIFEFISTISTCEDCNTLTFPPDLGIGDCVEYTIKQVDNNHEIELWVSQNCNFRYAQPEETRISILVNAADERIERISPQVEFIGDPTYCQQDRDCRCLSGSGVELIGCSNFLYAPLNWTGYYEGEDCGCMDGQCVPMDQESP